MPNVEKHVKYICGDCGNKLFSETELLSFERFQKEIGRLDILKPCTQHTDKPKPEEEKNEAPDVVLDETLKQKKEKAIVAAKVGTKEPKK